MTSSKKHSLIYKLIVCCLLSFILIIQVAVPQEKAFADNKIADKEYKIHLDAMKDAGVINLARIGMRPDMCNDYRVFVYNTCAESPMKNVKVSSKHQVVRVNMSDHVSNGGFDIMNITNTTDGNVIDFITISWEDKNKFNHSCQLLVRLLKPDRG